MFLVPAEMDNTPSSCFTRTKSSACRSACEEKCRTWQGILPHGPKRMVYRTDARKSLHGPSADWCEDHDQEGFGGIVWPVQIQME